MGTIAAMCAGCGGGVSSVDQAISQVEKGLEKAEKNKGNMTKADWENLGKEMEEPLQVINEAMETNKIGLMERVKVMTLMSKWAVVAMEAGLIEIGNSIDIEDAAQKLKNAAQGLEIENQPAESEQASE